MLVQGMVGADLHLNLGKLQQDFQESTGPYFNKFSISDLIPQITF